MQNAKDTIPARMGGCTPLLRYGDQIPGNKVALSSTLRFRSKLFRWAAGSHKRIALLVADGLSGMTHAKVGSKIKLEGQRTLWEAGFSAVVGTMVSPLREA